MTPQERQLVDDLFGRLAEHGECAARSRCGRRHRARLAVAPNAVYALVQTVLVQDEALKRANGRIQELEAAARRPKSIRRLPRSDARRDIRAKPAARFGAERPRRPNASRPVWNSGQVLQQAQSARTIRSGAVATASLWLRRAAGADGRRRLVGGGGGSFLGTAAAAAAGVVGGSLLLGSIRSMMGGGHHGFGDAGGAWRQGRQPAVGRSVRQHLARDAGIDDIGSSAAAADDGSRAGLFDTASNDDNDDDDMDGFRDFDDDGDSDCA